jgi:hypothetical protein
MHPERIPALSECRLCGIYLVVCSVLTKRCQGNPHREINGIFVALGRPLKVGARRIESEMESDPNYCHWNCEKSTRPQKGSSLNFVPSAVWNYTKVRLSKERTTAFVF